MITKDKKHKSFKVACVQVNAGNDIDINLTQVCPIIQEASASGADLVILPENVVMMEWGRKKIVKAALTENDHKGLVVFKEIAIKNNIWLHCGSLSIMNDNGCVSNRSFVFSPEGEIVGRYDKIHMFDVDLGNGERFSESSTYNSGRNSVLVNTPWGNLGLTICYDLRFPYLFRDLAKSGASMISVPSAFTYFTGKDHWHVLLRARAIETGAFIFAPAQTGYHPGERRTFGHSLMVDPWGRILAEANEEIGFIISEINLQDSVDARKMIPSLEHDKDFLSASL